MASCVCFFPLTKPSTFPLTMMHPLLFFLPHTFPLCFPYSLLICPFMSWLLCCPTLLLITSPIGCAPLALRWLCPLPECHLCPRSASGTPLHPPRGPLRSRSIDRQKGGMTTSVSADGALDPSLVRTSPEVHGTCFPQLYKNVTFKKTILFMFIRKTEVKAFTADR